MRMSVAEKYLEEGIEIGIDKGISRVAELITAGYSLEEAVEIAKGKRDE